MMVHDDVDASIQGRVKKMTTWMQKVAILLQTGLKMALFFKLDNFKCIALLEVSLWCAVCTGLPSNIGWNLWKSFELNCFVFNDGK